MEYKIWTKDWGNNNAKDGTGTQYKGNYNSRKKIEMGDTFDIVYDPNDPNHSYLKEQIHLMNLLIM